MRDQDEDREKVLDLAYSQGWITFTKIQRLLKVSPNYLRIRYLNTGNLKDKKTGKPIYKMQYEDYSWLKKGYLVKDTPKHYKIGTEGKIWLMQKKMDRGYLPFISSTIEKLIKEGYEVVSLSKILNDHDLAGYYIFWKDLTKDFYLIEMGAKIHRASTSSVILSGVHKPLSPKEISSLFNRLSEHKELTKLDIVDTVKGWKLNPLYLSDDNDK